MTIRIAVMNFVTGELDIIECDSKDIALYTSIGEYLRRELKYNLEDISWMSGITSINFLNRLKK